MIVKISVLLSKLVSQLVSLLSLGLSQAVSIKMMAMIKIRINIVSLFVCMVLSDGLIQIHDISTPGLSTTYYLLLAGFLFDENVICQ